MAEYKRLRKPKFELSKSSVCLEEKLMRNSRLHFMCCYMVLNKIKKSRNERQKNHTPFSMVA